MHTSGVRASKVGVVTAAETRGRGQQEAEGGEGAGQPDTQRHVLE